MELDAITAKKMLAESYWLYAIKQSGNMPVYGTLEFRQYVANLAKNTAQSIERLFELKLTNIELVKLRLICEDICKRCFVINNETDHTLENLSIEARHRFFLENYDYPIGHPIVPFDEKRIALWEQEKRHLP